MAFLGIKSAYKRLFEAVNTNNISWFQNASISTEDINNPNQSIPTNPRPLERAIALGLVNIAKILLEKGALPQLQDFEGNNALHLVAGHGRDNLADRSFQILANQILTKTRFVDSFINTVNNYNQTPLDIALNHGNTFIADALREYGARAAQPKNVAAEQNRSKPNKQRNIFIPTPDNIVVLSPAPQTKSMQADIVKSVNIVTNPPVQAADPHAPQDNSNYFFGSNFDINRFRQDGIITATDDPLNYMILSLMPYFREKAKLGILTTEQNERDRQIRIALREIYFDLATKNPKAYIGIEIHISQLVYLQHEGKFLQARGKEFNDHSAIRNSKYPYNEILGEFLCVSANEILEKRKHARQQIETLKQNQLNKQQPLIQKQATQFFAADFDLDSVVPQNYLQVDRGYRDYVREYGKQKYELGNLTPEQSERAKDIQKRLGHALWQLDPLYFNINFQSETAAVAIFDDIHNFETGERSNVSKLDFFFNADNQDKRRVIAGFFQMTETELVDGLREKNPALPSAAYARPAPGF